jgi:hypothetical protein
MSNKKQGLFERLMEYGVGPVYTILLSLSIGITKWLIIGILFFIAWWERVR